MGTDVSMHIEVKLHGVWQHWSSPHVPRNYGLFARMAGVRGDAEPITEPRGIPPDAATITVWDYNRWGEDAHTPSWLTSSEAVELVKYVEYTFHQIWCWLPGGIDFSGFVEYPEDRAKGFEDFRLVFWFDC